MNIVYIVNTAWYFDLHWLDRAINLVKRGCNVHLITSFVDDDEKVRHKLELAGIKCHQVALSRFSKNPIQNILLGYHIDKLLRIIKPDLVHLITVKPIVLGGIILKLKNRPFVVSFVGLGRVFNSKRSFLQYLVKKVYRYILSDNKKMRVIFEHNDDYQVLKKDISFIDKNVFVINGAGIDIDKYEYQEETVNDEVRILFASRLLWSKGLGELVEAVGKLKKEGLKVVLDVAGIIDEEDPDKINISIIEQWACEKKIVWLGKRNDVDNLIRKSNIVALPTKYAEGVPRIILEACSIGRACVVSSIPGCKAVIKNNYNGIVLNEVSSESISEKIKFLSLNSNVRIQYGLLSSEIIREKFSNKIVLSETFNVYESLLKSKS